MNLVHVQCLFLRVPGILCRLLPEMPCKLWRKVLLTSRAVGAGSLRQRLKDFAESELTEDLLRALLGPYSRKTRLRRKQRRLNRPKREKGKSFGKMRKSSLKRRGR